MQRSGLGVFAANPEGEVCLRVAVSLPCAGVGWALQGLNLRLPPCEGGTLPLS